MTTIGKDMWKKISENKLLIFALTLAFLSIISIFFPYNLLDGKEIFGFTIETKPYNELGTFIAGITTPFASLSAFILIFLTYRSQRVQYIESKKEIDIQMFNSTFFHTVNLINEIKKNMRIIDTDNINIYHQGYDSIIYLKNYLKKCYERQISIRSKEESGEELKNNCIQETLKKYGYIFEQYYENIKLIVNNIIISNIINENGKENYLNILKTQISLDELCILLFLEEHHNDNLFNNMTTKYKEIFLKRNDKPIKITDLLDK